MIRQFIFTFFLSCSLASCAIIDNPKTGEDELTSVEPVLGSAEIEKENLPVRSLRVVVFSNANEPLSYIEFQFERASELLRQQVGVRLEVTHVHATSWTPRTLVGLMLKTNEKAYAYPSNDIVIGIALAPTDEEKNCHEFISGRTKNCTAGIAFSSHAIVLQNIDVQYIVHEIGHLFIGMGHSLSGAMQGVVESPYFSVADRKRFLDKKWKNTRALHSLQHEQ